MRAWPVAAFVVVTAWSRSFPNRLPDRMPSAGLSSFVCETPSEPSESRSWCVCVVCVVQGLGVLRCTFLDHLAIVLSAISARCERGSAIVIIISSKASSSYVVCETSGAPTHFGIPRHTAQALLAVCVNCQLANTIIRSTVTLRAQKRTIAVDCDRLVGARALAMTQYINSYTG